MSLREVWEGGKRVRNVCLLNGRTFQIVGNAEKKEERDRSGGGVLSVYWGGVVERIRGVKTEFICKCLLKKRTSSRPKRSLSIQAKEGRHAGRGVVEDGWGEKGWELRNVKMKVAVSLGEGV